MEDMKICSSCKVEKPLVEFYYQKGRCKSWCKECTKEKVRQRVAKDRDKFSEEKRIKHRLDPRIEMRRGARRRSTKKKIPFNITIDDIEIPEICPILGIPLFVADGIISPNSPTLDRIIPELGYTKSNIQVISNRANLMKSDSSFDELLVFAKWVLSKQKEINE